MSGRLSVLILIAAAPLCAADKPSREIQELQRDVAQVQEMIKTMQQSLETRLTALAGQIQSAGDASAKVNPTVAGLEKGLAGIAQTQDGKILPAVAQQASRIDGLSTSLAAVQQAVGDLTTAVNRLQTQVVDLGKLVSVVQSPQGPPKPSAAELLRSAEADKLGGKYELAVQEYIDYLKQYPDTPEADAALFQLAMTHYAMKDYESTVRECDALVEKYSESKRIPEALLYKSKSLQALGKGANARAVCADLRKRFAASEFAKQCPVAARQ